MALLTKTQIIEAEDGKSATVEVPEWGGEVRVRSLRGWQRGELAREGDKVVSWDGLVCLMGIVDEKGNPFFIGNELDKLASKHPLVLARIARRILELSGLTSEAQGDIDANFPAIQTSSGGSSSPGTTEPNTTESTMGQT